MTAAAEAVETSVTNSLSQHHTITWGRLLKARLALIHDYKSIGRFGFIYFD